MEKIEFIKQAKSLLGITRDVCANMANLSALIFNNVEKLNWVGFYLLKNGQLVLGPFQGKPACVLIAMGKGVCGYSAKEGKTVIVPDVHKFPGHIACDSASNSEIVVPLFKNNGDLFGVLDIDSPILNRFGKEEEELFTALAEILTAASDL